MKTVEETLKENGFDLDMFISSSYYDGLVKVIKNECIQAQIDCLNKQKDRLISQSIYLNDIEAIPRLKGKCEGIKMAIENIRQELQELESQKCT